jgi:hypothetical protein
MWRRKSQAVSFTLTEVFALLFFALALALAWVAHQEREARARIDALAPVLSTMSNDVFGSIVELAASVPHDRIPDDFDELIRDMARIEAAREALRERMTELQAEGVLPEEMELDELIEAMIERSRQDEQMANALAAASGLSESDRSVLEEMAERITVLEATNVDLTGQVGYLRGRGLDHPPCWADPGGGIEYAFEVVIHTDMVDVSNIWPARRDAAARGIPEMLQLEGSALSYPEFSRRALPILQHSRQQDPECRHFVRILDRVDGGKDPFKDGLLTVERFFYKLLVD